MNEENNQNNQFNNIGIGMEPQPLGDLTNETSNLNNETPQKEKKKGRLKLIILIVASAIIAISAGYFAYTTLFNTPYNTYKNTGLPPGPIASPGAASIEAALYPADTDYFYFVLNPEDNSHVYSKTLSEHNENVKKYLN